MPVIPYSVQYYLFLKYCQGSKHILKLAQAYKLLLHWISKLYFYVTLNDSASCRSLALDNHIFMLAYKEIFMVFWGIFIAQITTH